MCASVCLGITEERKQQKGKMTSEKSSGGGGVSSGEKCAQRREVGEGCPVETAPLHQPEKADGANRS